MIETANAVSEDESTKHAKIEEVRRKIEELDLDPIKVKLMDSEEGEGWTPERVTKVERLYRRFLFLSLKYQGRAIVPNKLVDKFWHQHILDTRKYADDCKCVFGFFFHHFPYFGLRGKADAKNLQDAFAETKSAYAEEYGSDYEADHRFPTDTRVLTAGECSSCSGESCAGEHHLSESDPRLQPNLRPMRLAA